ncbi:MAG: DUF3343 domain-containing protein [Actinomycetota bacterium]|nr:DUF3343 domain-containing protein [Actinomycetota bacterium]
MKGHSIITFYSTHHALKAERILKEKIEVVVVPVPRSISANCGIALKIAPESEEEARVVLKEGRVPFEAIWLEPNS